MDTLSGQLLGLGGQKRLAVMALAAVVGMVCFGVWAGVTPSCPPDDDSNLAACDGPAWKSVSGVAAQGVAWAALLVFAAVATAALAAGGGATPESPRAYYAWGMFLFTIATVVSTLGTMINGGGSVWTGFVVNFYAPIISGTYVLYCASQVVRKSHT